MKTRKPWTDFDYALIYAATDWLFVIIVVLLVVVAQTPRIVHVIDPRWLVPK